MSFYQLNSQFKNYFGQGENGVALIKFEGKKNPAIFA